MIQKVLSIVALSLTLIACSTVSSLQSNASTSESGKENAVFTPGFSGYTDVPVPGGTKMNVERSFVLGAGDTWIGRLVLATNGNIAETYDFYLTKMPDYDWKQLTSIRADVSVLSYVRGDRVATITMQPQSLRGTDVNFTVSPRGADIRPGNTSSKTPKY